MTSKHDIRRAIGTVALTGAALAAGLGASLSAFAHLNEKRVGFRLGNQADLNDILCLSVENSKCT